MDFEEKKKDDIRGDLERGQKLTLADIRQTAPDLIMISHTSGDLRPERHFVFIVTKGNEETYYRDEELDLNAEEMAILKEEFEVHEETLHVTPGPAAMKRARLEWEEWEKKHGKRPRFQPEASE